MNIVDWTARYKCIRSIRKVVAYNMYIVIYETVDDKKNKEDV